MSPKPDNTNLLERQYRFIITIGKAPSDVTAMAETFIEAETITEAAAKMPHLLRADLLVFTGKPTDAELDVLTGLVHEAGLLYLPEVSTDKMVAKGFSSTDTKSVYQRGEGNTPLAYDDRYLARWGDLDFMHNWKMSGEQILVHLPSGKHKEDARIFDVGCLNGYIMESLRRCGARNVYGCDISYELAIKSQVDPYHLPAITIGDFINNRYDDSISDMTICMEVLEHLPPINTDAFIDELSRVTADDGVILISTSEDWDADPTHLNCKSRREWFYVLAKHNLVPAKRRQLIYGGFNSYIVRKAKTRFEALFFQAVYGILFWLERWADPAYRQQTANRVLPKSKHLGRSTDAPFGEDIIVRNIFDRLGKPKPSYFDISSYRFAGHSLSKHFSRFGSKGIMVHPDKETAARFASRNRDHHYVGDLTEAGQTIPEILKAKWKGHFPELLVLDMGKRNSEILKTIPYRQARPSVMAIAALPTEKKLETQLAEVDYTYYSHTPGYQIFVRNDLLDKVVDA